MLKMDLTLNKQFLEKNTNAEQVGKHSDLDWSSEFVASSSPTSLNSMLFIVKYPLNSLNWSINAYFGTNGLGFKNITPSLLL